MSTMLTLNDLVISSHDTLRSAMQRMTRNRKGILFVCDRDARLMGVISDGDVRRIILDDSLLLTPIGKAMNLSPIMARTVQEASGLLRRRELLAVPVVDEEGKITEAVYEHEGQLNSVSLAALHEGQGAHIDSLQALALVPARGGSKRIHKKNLAMVAGKPLVAWAVLAAKSARHVGSVVVSTDDPEISAAARTAGASVPWMRPAELSQDDTPTLDVILHALNWALQELRPSPEFAVLLEPTAPLRHGEHVDQALWMLAQSDADSVVSVSEVPHMLNPEELLRVENGLLRAYQPSRTMDSRRLRGQQEPAYVQNGLVYAFRVRSVLEHCSIYGLKVIPLMTSWDCFVDVDVKEDLEWANFRMRDRHRDQ